MDALITLLAVGAVNLLMFPVLAFIIKRGLSKKLDSMDEKRELARRQSESEASENRLWRQAMEGGMKSLLRAELLHEHNKWVDRGHCPMNSKEYLTRLYNAYKGVGGNSIGDALYRETMELPTGGVDDDGRED